eukprot:1160777-Pelagomonas_calceolata.AAC.1
MVECLTCPTVTKTAVQSPSSSSAAAASSTHQRDSHSHCFAFVCVPLQATRAHLADQEQFAHHRADFNAVVLQVCAWLLGGRQDGGVDVCVGRCGWFSMRLGPAAACMLAHALPAQLLLPCAPALAFAQTRRQLPTP